MQTRCAETLPTHLVYLTLKGDNMLILAIILFIVSLSLGIVFALGKGSLLAKSKNDEFNQKLTDEKSSKFIAKIMFTVAFCAVLMGAGAVVCYAWLSQLGLIIMAVALIFGVSKLS